MADWKTVQQIVNERADTKLHAAINGCVSCADFPNIMVPLSNGGNDMRISDMQAAIHKALFIANRDKWRTKEGEEFLKAQA